MKFKLTFKLAIVCFAFIGQTAIADTRPCTDVNDTSARCREKSENLVTQYRETLDAANQGDTKALLRLADLTFLGQGIKQDFRKAISLLEKAFYEGEKTVAFTLAGYYLHSGLGRNDAAYWFQIAANEGNPNALRSLGDMYRQGHGSKRDFCRAAYWYGLYQTTTNLQLEEQTDARKQCERDLARRTPDPKKN